MVKVLCPPFSWSSKGGFNLSSSAAAAGRRDTFSKIDPDVSVAVQVKAGSSNSPATSSSVPHTNGDARSTLTVHTDNSKKPSSTSTTSVRSDLSGDSGFLAEPRRSSLDEEQPRRHRDGVIAQHIDSNSPIKDIHYDKYSKDDTSVHLIRGAMVANEFLKSLMDEERLNAVVEAMSPQEHPADSYIIRQGENGSHLYISASGQFEVLKNGVVMNTFGAGVAFGEIAILYKAKRMASIRCKTNAKVWVLERRVFQKIMVRSGRQEQEDNIRFLTSVPVLQGIHPIELVKISDVLKREFFSAGTAVVRQGDRGDKFYIIRGGTAVVTKREGDGEDVKVGLLSRGDFFGEQALLHGDRRLATVTAQAPGVECLWLDRVPFTELLGGLENLKKVKHSAPRPSETKAKTSRVKSEYDHVQLHELEIVGTMGVGGFGRVELVQYQRDRSLTFALKCLKKIDMVQQQQQEHAYNEKHIMLSCNSPFVCRLYKTFKDNKYVYFLMEPVLGGDVWTVLQKQRFFTEPTARFMSACVVEAFQYLHSNNMIYRDLKPENLMLDSRGYVKLVDFGFAKHVTAGSKTWTFAGTPEYVSPEIILNKGHDRAVDYWALGVFIHELLVGKPPFRGGGNDHMKTYTLILRGIDAVTFNPRLTKSAQMLIKKLCRPVPYERLGYLKNGINDIKNHKWYLGFEWDKLRDGTMKAPLVRPVSSNTDLVNFEKYPKDKLPPDENSGWDIDF